jgi:plastocyanin
LVVVLATSCSGSVSPAPAPAAQPPTASLVIASSAGQIVAVTMTDAFQYQPATVSAPRGATVTWTNTGSEEHTVTSDSSKAVNKANASIPSGAQAWDSGLIKAGQSFSRTLDTPVAYKYVCTLHESLGMLGTITVTS